MWPTKPTTPLRLTLFFITFFSITLLFFVPLMERTEKLTSISTAPHPVIISQREEDKAVLADNPLHQLPLHEYVPINGTKIHIGLVNVDDEEEIRRWEKAGRVHRVVFDHVAVDVTWERLFPEWIDEDERHEKPECPAIPMPKFEDYPELDVVVVRAPCGIASPLGRGERDVFRLQVHLVAAKLAARRLAETAAATVVFIGPCPAMLEIFRCEDVVVNREGLTVYRPDLRRLRQKIRLPVGSCKLAVPLANKHG